MLLTKKIVAHDFRYDLVFTAKSLNMFRVSQQPSLGVLKTVTTASGTGHTVKYKD